MTAPINETCTAMRVRVSAGLMVTDRIDNKLGTRVSDKSPMPFVNDV